MPLMLGSPARCQRQNLPSPAELVGKAGSVVGTKLELDSVGSKTFLAKKVLYLL